MIRENPLLGSGPGTFPLHYATTGYAKAFSANRQDRRPVPARAQHLPGNLQ